MGIFTGIYMGDIALGRSWLKVYATRCGCFSLVKAAIGCHEDGHGREDGLDAGVQPHFTCSKHEGADGYTYAAAIHKRAKNGLVRIMVQNSDTGMHVGE